MHDRNSIVSYVQLKTRLVDIALAFAAQKSPVGYRLCVGWKNDFDWLPKKIGHYDMDDFGCSSSEFSVWILLFWFYHGDTKIFGSISLNTDFCNLVNFASFVGVLNKKPFPNEFDFRISSDK